MLCDTKIKEIINQKLFDPVVTRQNCAAGAWGIATVRGLARFFPAS